MGLKLSLLELRFCWSFHARSLKLPLALSVRSGSSICGFPLSTEGLLVLCVGLLFGVGVGVLRPPEACEGFSRPGLFWPGVDVPRNI